MNRLPRYTYQGVTLPLRGWAKRLGADLRALEARLARGWSVEQTLATPLAPSERPPAPAVPYRPPRTSYILEADGRFMTVKDWARELNCPRHALYACLRFNRPFIRRDGTRLTFTRHRAFEHDGIALRACAWAARLRISRDAFLQRISDGLGEADIYRANEDAPDR